MEDPCGDEFPVGIGMRKKLSAITLACREIEKLLPREDGDENLIPDDEFY